MCMHVCVYMYMLVSVHVFAHTVRMCVCVCMCVYVCVCVCVQHVYVKDNLQEVLTCASPSTKTLTAVADWRAVWLVQRRMTPPSLALFVAVFCETFPEPALLTL